MVSVPSSVEKANLTITPRLLIVDAHNLRSGGGFLYLKELIKNLEDYQGKFDHIRILVTKSFASGLKSDNLRLEIKVPFLLSFSSKLFHLLWILWFYGVHKPRNAVLFVVSGIYPFKCKVRSVVMFHSLLPLEEEAVSLYRGEKKYIKYRILNLLYKRSMRRADGLLFSSKFTEEKFLQTLSSSERPVSKVIPFGTWSSFRESAKTDSRAIESTVRFLYVSNFYRYKRHMMLIPLFEKLIGNGSDISLTLCGDGYVREKEIQNAVKESGYKKRIKYIGKLDHGNIQQLYQVHDVLIFPSIVESFGIPLIEAAYENLWILFTWPPLVEIMQNNSYKRYTLAENNLEEEIKNLLREHAAGKINLKEKKVNTHFIPFTRTASETMKYLESFLPGS